jgi:hypothetical protein
MEPIATLLPRLLAEQKRLEARALEIQHLGASMSDRRAFARKWKAHVAALDAVVTSRRTDLVEWLGAAGDEPADRFIERELLPLLDELKETI